jgi:hypothetical protein
VAAGDRERARGDRADLLEVCVLEAVARQAWPCLGLVGAERSFTADMLSTVHMKRDADASFSGYSTGGLMPSPCPPCSCHASPCSHQPVPSYSRSPQPRSQSFPLCCTPWRLGAWRVSFRGVLS